jgi:hypothetical protein
MFGLTFSKKVQLFLETFGSFPIVWKQLSQVFAVIIVVIRQPVKHILQPLLQVNATGIAGTNERIYHSRVFYRIVVSTEQIVFSADCQRTNGIFDQVVINLVLAVLYKKKLSSV